MQWLDNTRARKKRRKQRQERDRIKAADIQRIPEENKNIKESRRKAGTCLLKKAGLALAVLAVAAGGYLCLKSAIPWTAVQARLDILPDANAKKGSLHGGEPREIDPGDFRVLVNQIPAVEAGNRTCRIEYENPAGNHYSARISLYLKETGELLGNTRRVDPGNYVETIRLKQELPAGEYPVRANIELFENKTPAGNLAIDISLRVLETGTPKETVESETAGKEAAGWEAAENEPMEAAGW